MALITDYTTLQAAIVENLARADLADLAPDFVQQAENWLNFGSEDSPPLRCREMEEVTSLTPTDGVCTLPDDYLQYGRVVETTNPRRPLTYITPDAAEALYPSRAAGLASHFTIIGSSLYTFPLASNDIELTYYKTIPPLASNTTNWLLTKAPSVYLRASLFYAAEFIKNDAEAAKQAQLARTLVAGLNKSDMLGKYARAGVTMRGVTP